MQKHSQQSHRKSSGQKDKEAVNGSWLQMVRPYNKSQLKTSIFHGYFNLCYVMSIFFIFVYPLRKFITKGIFCEEEVLKMLETNGKWDMLSLAIFVVLGLTMMMIPARWVKLPVQVLLLGGFLAVGQYIVTSEPMYYSDRAFIVFLSWGFALKLFSYFNSNENGSASFWHKVLFFFSPRLIYEGFEEQRLPKRQILWGYLVKKLLLNFLCLFANCIIVVQFIDPVVANKERLTFIQLWFNLIPPVFYLNLCMFYFVFENVFSPLAEITKMRNRRFFQDWWNANNHYTFMTRFCTTVDDFLQHHIEKILTGLNSTWKQYLPQLKVLTFLVFSEIIAMQIFDKRVKLMSLLIFGLIDAFVIAVGNKNMGNYVVHGSMLACIPLLIALDLKFGLL